MRTRREQPDVPAPREPWSEIVPGLWMGGHAYAAGAGGGEVELAVVRDEFDLVLTLLRLPGHGPDDGVEHHVWPIPDGPLDGTQLAGVMRLAQAACDALEDGRKVLVRCYSGYNRSGLVVAHALVRDGHSPEEAIRLIRTRRSPWALHNELFVEYLHAGLPTVRLLEELEELAE
ncbi:protein phosphatase [Streptomyces ipomoeae]|uniref:protein-tyrosine-phosphatase n=1 Tax=Streptomyces ipomoeae TaxID=103232 RepID=A0A540PDT1_9ACTN|nr:dual specificity protein phosphatase family protein [Streptomyces ipomoeae]MDX2698577.1 dual specificity protein phosphatase family protein [Streptomyces ipomoeae]MDX2824689.1 dual specificity protein phosphatase family protein [Streptomyces ipomoeae]MDX2842963.1 dual specificity protein phosphatase family protein [Streptomyces ipomoeae]MDX2878559.1 dual specificity protein phosphatase family protein [Streptomyces ipomoeae]MDX2938271.1 dual specificity protein phosphatase family protein [St